MTKPSLDILLCAPRGFCAGVVRAIDAVERALAIHGAPDYVRHALVHHTYVVESLTKTGALLRRRRRAGHRGGGARARDPRGAGLRAPRDRPQQIRGRKPEEEGRDL